MSRKPALVRCNHASDPRCGHCHADMPHYPGQHDSYDHETCGHWGECWPNGVRDDPANFKVRCVRVRKEKP